MIFKEAPEITKIKCDENASGSKFEGPIGTKFAV